ncbi:hypothetical protein SSS_04539 [Sarcoptes scabiei]|uniref:Uncharacterized protein n=2 Tax=Sarcoptes scabiei TaxID=52283 RepID=A0A834RCE9_SARSC|nr:hypothetical protein SSS_04539 [Sarcoptes scabiei]
MKSFIAFVFFAAVLAVAFAQHYGGYGYGGYGHGGLARASYGGYGHGGLSRVGYAGHGGYGGYGGYAGHGGYGLARGYGGLGHGGYGGYGYGRGYHGIIFNIGIQNNKQSKSWKNFENCLESCDHSLFQNDPLRITDGIFSNFAYESSVYNCEMDQF